MDLVLAKQGVSARILEEHKKIMLSKKELEVLRKAVENYNEKNPKKMKGLSGSLQKAKEVIGADKSVWAPYTHILELYKEIERLNG